MAAHMRRAVARTVRTNLASARISSLNVKPPNCLLDETSHFASSGARSMSIKAIGPAHARSKLGALTFLGVGFVTACTIKAVCESKRPRHKVSRQIRSPTDTTGLKITLYQYQTCPFCCKVRAYLDYHGLSYDVIEVNSVWKTQLKWSDYRKVPTVIFDGQGDNGFLEVNDSSVIISGLQTYLVDKHTKLDEMVSYYSPLISEGKRGKKIYEFPNKYFVMYGQTETTSTEAQRKEERKWRSWVDNDLVHVLSPNVYRTPREALQAFKYFSDVGDWENVFSAFERQFVIHVGATAMYIMGKILKKKYSLKDDVRQSLFDSCKKWTKAVGKSRPYMGGDQPNLADLVSNQCIQHSSHRHKIPDVFQSVYGVLCSIEGCHAFKEALAETNIGPWFYRTKLAVEKHAGAHPANKQ